MKNLPFKSLQPTVYKSLGKKPKPKPGAKPRLVKINGLLAHQASSRVDPTRTTGLRNRWAAEMGRRFTALRRLVWKAIVDDDCFGLGPAYKLYRPAIHVKFDFPRLEDKIPAFMQWLQQQQDEGILELVTLPRMGQSLGEPWTNLFVRDSYERGVIRAREQLMTAGYGAPGLGAGELPLLELPGMASGILANPFHVDRLASVFLRSYDGLKGITAAMDMQVSHVLAQGLADGDNPITLAKKMNYVISGMGKDLGITDSLGRFIPAERRAKMLARTEVIRAHAQAQLQEFKVWGVAGVNVVAEWVTAGFNVCPQCQDKSRQGPYTIEQAWNLIPFHPHCRCCWVAKPRNEIYVHSNPCHNPAGPGGGQFCPTGGGGQVAKSEWKPSMSRAEANEWAKGSKYTATVFHATSSENAANISNSGFDLSKRGYGRVWGDGVYVALDKQSEAFWIRPDTVSLNLKIKLNNPFVSSDASEVSKIRDLAEKRILSTGKKLNEEGVSVARTMSDILRERGHDGIIIKEKSPTLYVGGNQAIVFNPKSVVVIK
jgi:hypothetical protein